MVSWATTGKKMFTKIFLVFINSKMWQTSGYRKYENLKWKFFESADTFEMQRGSKKNIGSQSDINVTIQNNLSGFDFFFNGTKMIDGLSNNGRIVRLAFEKKLSFFRTYLSTILNWWSENTFDVLVIFSVSLCFCPQWLPLCYVYLFVHLCQICVKFVILTS